MLERWHREHPDTGLAQVLVEDADAQAATRLGCQQWEDAFDLTYPVLVDPLFETETWVGSEPFPVHVAFAPTGEVESVTSGPFDAEEGAGERERDRR